MNRAVIAVGSNIEPEHNIARAKDTLAKEFILLAQSQFVVTTPIGYADQPDFINGALLIDTELDYDNLNARLKELETSLGRVKTGHKYGPRTIDLDIVVWNNTVVSDEVYQRDFVRNAVLEVVPDLQV